MKYIIILILLFVLELIYLKIATVKNIKDKPNHRSAHTKPTIRGGGIIYVFAFIIYAVVFNEENNFYFLLIGILLVSTISFIDDLIMLSSKLRLVTHLIGFSLMFYSLGFFELFSNYEIILLLATTIFSIGFLNIYNFMDGINGITFLNALISYSSLLFINIYYISFINSQLLIILILATSVFGFFNFRQKAVCFAGDIGSITIGFSLIYFVVKLYLVSNNLSVFLLLVVYLLDGGWTIVERIFKKENIFEAHKRHLYQLLANDFKIPHLRISIIYFIIQLSINWLVIFTMIKGYNGLFILLITFTIASLFYIVIKYKLHKRLTNKRELNN